MKNSKEIDLEKLELLMKSKSFAQLSDEEKEWVSQWVKSPGEYDVLRKFETQMHDYFQDTKINTPASAALGQLKGHLRRKTREQQAGIWWHLKPSLSTLSLAILFGFVGWWFGRSTTSPEAKPGVIKSAIVYDTIYIASKPDTIFTEKIIYKDRPVILTGNMDSKELKHPSSESNGINMKEKEELEKLLVSGTE